MSNLDNMSLPVVYTDSVPAYTNNISNIKVLSAEEEHELAVRLQKHGDLGAAKELIVANLRFVAHIARSYRGYGLPEGDLIQEGNVGLMKAVRRFDPERGVRLVSFAVHWIRAEIHEYVIRNWRIVKIATTKAQRKLFFNLRKAKNRLGWFTANEAELVANDLGVKVDTVFEMEKRLSGADVAFDLNADENDDDAIGSPSAWLEAPEADPSKLLEHSCSAKQQSVALQDALSQLNTRSQDIIEKRWLSEDKATLHDLAAKYGISAERVRQVEKDAIRKIGISIEKSIA